MERLVLYHNAGCSKSRGALQILEEKGADFDVIEYLKVPLSRGDLEAILSRIPDPASELLRRDKNFEALGLDASGYDEAGAIIDLLLEHPKLMQRPVAVLGDRGVIARPSEKVLELLEST
jgi:arsenate reductase